MASNRRERELARARVERQAARRIAKRAQQRRRRAVLAGVVTVLLVLAGGAYLVSRLADEPAPDTLAAAPSDPPSDPAAAPSEPSAPPTACGAQAPPPVTPKTFAAEPELTIDPMADYTMQLATSCGPISIALAADQAPRTVNVLSFLASEGYYDGSFCHRMTSSSSLTVLQCGDPEGTGSGGPGFMIGEENLEGATYGRGVVAMAKTSAPGSTGSQFFLISQDSQLPPEYTVVGMMDEPSLAVLDTIMAIGQDDSNGSGDGTPVERVYLEQVTVATA